MREFFGLDETWQRPRPASWWPDVVLAAALLLLNVVGIEVIRALARDAGALQPRWTQYIAITTAALLFVFRRRYPVTILIVLVGVHFVVTGVLVPEAAENLGSQILYFVAMLSAFAWARHRAAVLAAGIVVCVVMTGWLVWMFTLTNSLAKVQGLPHTGLLPPAAALILWTAVVNLIYFIGAVLGGTVLWQKARSDAVVREQAERLVAQSDEMARQAVFGERLRIARELHDVVAHHVSLIGIQAAAARRTLDAKPARAAQALGEIERSAREAVGEMRGLLQALRSDDDTDERSPVPTLGQLDGLIDASNGIGLPVDATVVGKVDGLPLAVSSTLFRVAQEALSNVRTHSTAKRATLAVRVVGSEAEVEVTDSGRPRSGTGGSGFGLRGIAERAAAFGGTSEVGPRPQGGFRVRVVLPLETS